METILSTKGLCKRFGGRLAVDHVDMTIHKGDIYGLIGKNGAGKTTFMRMVCGLAAPTEGTMRLFGSDDLEPQRRKMGCTIENPALYPAMTAQENMEVYRILLGIEEKMTTSELLEFVGLHDLGHKRAKDFSLGMKQRLMIAISLLGSPELLVLDEPMNGLDPTGIMEVRNLLLKLNHEKGLTIVISSHILEELSKIATRYGVIHEGRMIDTFTAEELETRCRKNVRFRTSNCELASALISGHVTKNLTTERGGDIVLYDHLEDAAKITRLLIENNIEVSAVVPAEQELEDYFMELIGGQCA